MMALKELGYPTVHTAQWYDQVDVLELWHRDIIMPSINSGKATPLGKPDFQKIADFGYTALADLPMCLYFEQLVEDFPDCKFILTERSSSEVWFESWVVMTQSITYFFHFGGLFIPTLSRYSDYLRWLYAYLNQDDRVLTMGWPYTQTTNKATAIPLYEEHNRRVRELVPPERLLVYNFKEGWDPMCKFLEIDDCPKTPFPKSNSKLSFKVQAVSAFCFAVGFFSFFVFLVSRCVRKLRKSNSKKKWE
jgi:hypothetical protein